MASSDANGGSLPHNFFLTPHQQNLLFAALNANNQQSTGVSTGNGMSLSPSSFGNSPVQAVGAQESPALDNYDYDFADSSYDFSFASTADNTLIGGERPSVTRSDSADSDGNEKRHHPDDEEDSPGNDAKRHEGSEKVPKKPGRKPLTSEPTSVSIVTPKHELIGATPNTGQQKRKAQNRAAQRAFRERKEKHLKDLETKVEELEKASEAANHENGLLRAQVERMTSELSQYKQRMALAVQNKTIQRDTSAFNPAIANGLNDVNFQFEFPKFGSLPGPPSKSSPSQAISPGQAASPNQSVAESKASPASQTAAKAAKFKEDLAQFSNIFTPSMGTSATNGSRGSLDSANFSISGATSSPSASSNSNAGPSSSCGTSPEPFTQSPMGFKPLDTMSTIGEEQPSIASTQQPFAQFTNIDAGTVGLDWLSQQNGGQFDPQLFGDYREPQANILANPSFDEFFNDAVDIDFFTPYNMAPTPNAPKKNLIAEIDAKQNSDETTEKTKNCNDIWYVKLDSRLRCGKLTYLRRERLQDCPSAKNGDFDLDGLCTELTKKAKCSGQGPVVREQDFDTILKKYMGKDASSDCVASKLGIEVKREPADA